MTGSRKREVTWFEQRLVSGKWYDDCWLLWPERLRELRSLLNCGEPAIRASIDELIKLFPADVCADLLSRKAHSEEMYGLFTPGNYLNVHKTILLGLDLSKAQGWEEDRNLVSALRIRDALYPRRVEIGIWAGLVRAGAQVQRVQETGEGPTPDFAVVIDGQRFALEVKCLESSDLDDTTSEISREFTNLLFMRHDFPDSERSGSSIRLELHPHLVDDLVSNELRKETMAQIMPMLEPAVGTLLTAMRNGMCEGELDLPGLGKAVISKGEPQKLSLQISGLPETSWEKQVMRALGSLRAAARQRIDGTSLVVVMHSSRFVMPTHGAIEIQRIPEAQERLRGIDAVVLHNHFREPEEPWQMVHMLSHWLPPGSDLQEVPERLMEGLRSWRREI